MTIKASSTLLLIIEKQHAAWDLMGMTLSPVKLRTVLCASHTDRRGRRRRCADGPAQATCSRPEPLSLRVFR